MIIGYIGMKLTFSNGKLYANVESFDFFYGEDGCKV